MSYGIKFSIIVDNDWFGSTSFIPVLRLLDTEIEVLGLTVVVGNIWLDQMALDALRFLELGNLSNKISVYKGATYPFLNNPFHPSGGDPTHIVLSALPEGLPTTKLQTMNTINFLIEQIHMYSHQVSILTLGLLTNIVLAIRLNSTCARNVKEIVIQDGFLDRNLAQITGSLLQADLNSDFNILFDPEAASIVLTADFPSFVLVGRAAMMATVNPSYIDSITTKINPYTKLIAKYYPRNLPMWNEATAAILTHSNLIIDTVYALADADIAYNGPFYGTIHI
ncbi:unnamed protein product [Rotaria sp. Silwood1]|nr:unnamed protein product [Rotaria sp. Silwood1]CAF1422112.1 unnamed protein product [Rotaria sp. Silwood1]CAF3626246.1 unnamed protein product [Rotaria sp. Silwood1]CAF4645412.1 unnamed protein product [Rotaria sp. Silwood1]CAF4745422.1 unnamed protein product [Rotaria sp. Silwood1]